MNTPHTPVWLHIARSYIGLREVPGPGTAPQIAVWLHDLNAWWKGDEEPWCGTFAGGVFLECGIEPPAAWYRAKAWLKWGTPLEAPQFGCIVVFDRKGGGHVNFCEGRNARGQLVCVGGNQGDAVSRAAFDTDRVLGYVWPAEAWAALEYRGDELPLLATNEPTSRNEA